MTQTRMTRQRAVILEMLRSVTTHPTADEIYQMVRLRLPKISLGTVYRNLDILTSAGEIRCLDNAGAQKRFDGNMCAHHHVRCQMCGKVGDIFTPIAIEPIAAETVPDFTIMSAEVAFVGVCRNCQAQTA